MFPYPNTKKATLGYIGLSISLGNKKEEEIFDTYIPIPRAILDFKKAAVTATEYIECQDAEIQWKN